MCSSDEMSLADVLSDPLILAVARADGLSHGEFKTFLQSAARRLQRQSAPAAPVMPRKSWRDWTSVNELCCA